jgi:hypothetical protein
VGAEITRSAKANRLGEAERGADRVADNFQGRASAHLFTGPEQTTLNFGVAIAEDFVHLAHVSETTATPAGGKASCETKNAGMYSLGMYRPASATATGFGIGGDAGEACTVLRRFGLACARQDRPDPSTVDGLLDGERSRVGRLRSLVRYSVL